MAAVSAELIPRSVFAVSDGFIAATQGCGSFNTVAIFSLDRAKLQHGDGVYTVRVAYKAGAASSVVITGSRGAVEDRKLDLNVAGNESLSAPVTITLGGSNPKLQLLMPCDKVQALQVKGVSISGYSP